MKDLIIGIDAGTSVIKSIAFDLSGKQIALAAQKNDYLLTNDGGAEQDIGETWQKTAHTLQELIAAIPDLAHRTAAIAVTGQGDGTWLIDDAGKPVGPALLWLDGRAATLAASIASSENDTERFSSTGTGLNGCQQGPQLRWLLENRSSQVSQASSAHHCKDWLYYCLTGERVTDPSEGVFSFGNFRTRDYDDNVISALGLSAQRSLLPPILDGSQYTHGLSKQTADLLGLLEGTPVSLGYVDVVCTALGAGLFNPGMSAGVTIVGSTGMHMLLKHGADSISLNSDRTGYTMAMPIPDTYAQLQSNMAATLNIDWLLDTAVELCGRLGIEKSRTDVLPVLEQAVAEAEPGQLLFQPYISEAGERGPFIDGHARAGFVGLSSQHGFNNLARSIFEGLAFAARDCYQAMGDLPEQIVLSGGAARSEQLLTILSATLNSQLVRTSREEAGAAGAAMMAAVAIGAYRSMDACVAEWVQPLLTPAAAPDAELAKTYESLFSVYQQTQRQLSPVWRNYADFRSSNGRNQ